MAQQVLSITQINEYIRGKLDEDALLNGVAVKGEISNYKLYPSGHHYFTLKDEKSLIKCIMFKTYAEKLTFMPKDGMKVLIEGKIEVYKNYGTYQLYVSEISKDGIGDLHIAFEQLKKKLAAEGLFDESRKRPLPPYPTRVGVITSPTGAAVRDILNVLGRRYPLAQVVFCPVLVQGDGAAPSIVDAIQRFNAIGVADVLIVGRGGGSIEDLWAFNDEHVAHAIYESEIPVISAVGHEPDVTISDYVADLRAATPSNGAELAVPDQDALRQTLDSFSSALAAAAGKQIKAARQHYNILSSNKALQSPIQYIRILRDSLQHQSVLLVNNQTQNLTKHRQAFLSAAAKLDAMSPLKVLTRGYSMVTDQQDHVIRSVLQVNANDQIHITLSDGSMTATVAEIRGNQDEQAK